MAAGRPPARQWHWPCARMHRACCLPVPPCGCGSVCCGHWPWRRARGARAAVAAAVGKSSALQLPRIGMGFRVKVLNGRRPNKKKVTKMKGSQQDFELCTFHNVQNCMERPPETKLFHVVASPFDLVDVPGTCSLFSGTCSMSSFYFNLVRVPFGFGTSSSCIPTSFHRF